MDTGEQVGTITTDENGVGTITGLIKQAYTVKEIQAPTGYVLSEEPIKISRMILEMTSRFLVMS